MTYIVLLAVIMLGVILYVLAGPVLFRIKLDKTYFAVSCTILALNVGANLLYYIVDFGLTRSQAELHSTTLAASVFVCLVLLPIFQSRLRGLSR